MAKKKLLRFEQNTKTENVIEDGKELYTTIKGNWHNVYFKNNNPITLELACGYGELTVTFAEHYPERNFIGVDIKGARIWKGSQTAFERGFKNAAFLRTSIRYLEEFFVPGEIDEVYIMFPDPQPIQEQYRLTNERFLTLYKSLLKKGGIMHLKTDNPPFYHYTLEMAKKMGGRIIFETTDFYNSEMKDSHFGVTTFYEQFFTGKGEIVHYVQFSLD